VALALSFVLHAATVLPALLFAPRPRAGPQIGALCVDTRAPAPDIDVRLALWEPPDHPPTPKPAPALVPAAAPSVSSPKPTRDARAERPSPPTLFPAATAERLPPLASDSPGLNGAGPSGGGSGAGAATTFFQIGTEAQAVVYVIDRSGSMGLNGSLAAAKRELVASLERLPATARFQVIFYNRIAEPLRIHGRTDLVPASVENKAEAARLLEAISAEGSTEHLPALTRALALGPDIIFFLTDADDMRADQVRAVTMRNHGRAVIHTVGLCGVLRARAEQPLAALARANGGVYREVPLPP
jgi:hypothetical protein